MCRARNLGVSGNKETLTARLRQFLFDHAGLKEEERNILTDFAKNSSNRRDFSALVSRLEGKGYERGIREVQNLLHHLLPDLYPKEEEVEPEPRPTAVRSSRVEKDANNIDQIAYDSSFFFVC